MDTSTGKIYELNESESVKQLARRLGLEEKNMVELGKLPDETCRKCGGKGYKRRGMFSKRFKPCECTKTNAL